MSKKDSHTKEYSPLEEVQSDEQLFKLYEDIEPKGQFFGTLSHHDVNRQMKLFKEKLRTINGIKRDLHLVEKVDNVSRAGHIAAGLVISFWPPSHLVTGSMLLGANIGNVISGVVNDWTQGSNEQQMNDVVEKLVKDLYDNAVDLRGEIKENFDNDFRERKALEKIDEVVREAFDDKTVSDKELELDLAELERILDAEQKAKDSGKKVTAQAVKKRKSIQAKVQVSKRKVADSNNRLKAASAQRNGHISTLNVLSRQRQQIERKRIPMPPGIIQYGNSIEYRVAQLHQAEAKTWAEFAHLHRILYGNQAIRIQQIGRAHV